MVVPCSRAVLGVCRHAKIQSLIAQWSFLYPTYILETLPGRRGSQPESELKTVLPVGSSPGLVAVTE